MQFAKWIVAISVVVLSACTEISGGPVEGRVTDKESGQPVEGAVVLIKWNMATGGMLAGTHYVCYHIEAARTDANGHYLVPKWRVKLGLDETGAQMKWLPFNQTSDLYLEMLKPGYLRGSNGMAGAPGRVDLKPTKFNGTDAAWFAEWEKQPQFDTSCLGGETRIGIEANIAVYERLGTTTSHREIVTYLKNYLKDPDFGKYGITNRSQRK